MRGVRLSSTVIAATVYAGTVFTIGFALGIVRTLFVAPRVGAFAAVAIELPLILSAAWLVCGWVFARFRVPSGLTVRTAMAVAAFAVAMALEFGFATLAFGTPPGVYMRAFMTAAGLLGLAGQIVFAIFPMVHRIRPRPRRA